MRIDLAGLAGDTRDTCCEAKNWNGCYYVGSSIDCLVGSERRVIQRVASRTLGNAGRAGVGFAALVGFSSRSVEFHRAFGRFIDSP